MKKLVLIFGLFYSFVALGKEASDSLSRIEIGMNVSASYCYRTLSANTYPATFIMSLRNKEEIPRLGYSGGIGLRYRFSKNWKISLGVQYSTKGYKHDVGELIFGDAITPRYGMSYPTTSSNSTIVMGDYLSLYYNYNYLEVPIRMTYLFGKKKLSFIAGAGVTSGFLLSATETFKFKNYDGSTKSQTVTQAMSFNKISLSPTISFGINYKLNKKLNLSLESILQYGILKTADSPLHEYLWDGGLNAGVYYSL